jgi:hypothetical protein
MSRGKKALSIWVGLLVLVLLSGTDAPASLMLFPTLIFLGDATGMVAKKKGRSYMAFFIVGCFIPIFGLILALLLPAKTSEKSFTENLVEKSGNQ